MTEISQNSFDGSSSYATSSKTSRYATYAPACTGVIGLSKCCYPFQWIGNIKHSWQSISLQLAYLGRLALYHAPSPLSTPPFSKQEQN